MVDDIWRANMATTIELLVSDALVANPHMLLSIKLAFRSGLPWLHRIHVCLL